MVISLIPTAFAAVTEADLTAAGLLKETDDATWWGRTNYVGFVVANPSNATLVPKDGSAAETALDDTWLQLLSPYYLPWSGDLWLPVWHKHKAYRVKADEVSNRIYVGETLKSYIKTNIWTMPEVDFFNMSEGDNLTGNIFVYSLQLALQETNYLSSSPDGGYGSGTKAAVEKFQKAYKELTVDGIAGPATQKKLYDLALNGFTASTDADALANGATYAGTSPDSISPSSPKHYIRFGNDTNSYKTATNTGTAVVIPKDAVLQLVANRYYTRDNNDYMSVYYNNTIHNVVVNQTLLGYGTMSAAQLRTHFTNVLWVKPPYASLNKDLKLVGSPEVHGLQYALSLLGHYSGALDGNFGSGTENAIKAFQRANGMSADGRAGPATQPEIYKQALALINNGTYGDIFYGGAGGGSTSGSTGSGSTSTPTTGTLITTANVNHRKTTSTRGVRLGVVPKNTTLAYSDLRTSGGSDWYKVVYNNKTGWLQGLYVSANNTGSGSGGSSIIGSGASGDLVITLPGTRVRKSPGGSKTGTSLSKDTIVPYYTTTTSGGYTWYYITASNGVSGYVRSDCVNVLSSGGSGSSGGGGVIQSSNKEYIIWPSGVTVFTAETQPDASKRVSIPTGAVIQRYSDSTYTKDYVTYSSIYFNNTKYNVIHDEIKNAVMTSTEFTDYIVNTLWKQTYSSSLKETMNLIGDARVHGAQMALSILGFYTGNLDGNFGSGTSSAVRNFQRKNSLSVDGSIGPATWAKLFPMAVAAYTGGTWTSSGGGTSSGNFGTVNAVDKGNWSTIRNNNLFPQGSTAQIMDKETGHVFTVYRIFGSNHADVIPNTAADTKTICDIVGYPYNSNHPDTTQLNRIKNDPQSGTTPTYTWPDFKGTLGGVTRNIGSAWDRRAAVINLNGRVYPISIYGWPHGFNDTTYQKMTLGGQSLYKRSNYYGMMCIHFNGSTTHTGDAPDSGHTNSINEAYTWAVNRFR